MHHYRNGTELSYLDSDLAYDFNYQETRILSPEVTVQNVSITIGARERGWVGGWKGGCGVGCGVGGWGGPQCRMSNLRNCIVPPYF